MPTKRFMIAPFETGLQTNIKPWIIPDDAFELLQNAYIYRGRVRKRFGSRLMNESGPQALQPLASRLRVDIGSTDGNGDSLALPVPGVVQEPGQLFSCGDVFFTITADGVVTVIGAPSRVTSATATFTFAGPTFQIAGSDALIANLSIYFYPAQPVMGLITLETDSINDDRLIGFDRQFAYEYITGGWVRLSLGDSLWTGSNSQFFWADTFFGIVAQDQRLFVVNYKPEDGIRNFNVSISTWEKIDYITSGTNVLNTAKMVIVFKGRLLALNTIETQGGPFITFVNRIRWSQLGSVVDAANSFSEEFGRGGFIDAPTKEVIVSASIIKDRLIVFFERSTWELVFQGNDIDPFKWQKINSELGAESTFASVIFDGDIVGVGNVGIHACNGAYVKRIDDKIPNLVFDVHNKNSGVERVYGIRDYEAEMIYWTFPAAGRQPAGLDPIYPNQVLTFNYKTLSWGINDDTITCFGYFQLQDDLTWASIESTWDGYDEQWVSGDFQALNRTVLAGNQEGFTFVINKDLNKNAPVLQITQLTLDGGTGRPNLKILSHNFIIGEYIRIQDCIGNTDLNDTIYEIVQIVDIDNIQVIQPGFDGTPAYLGGGTIRRISRIDILTKEYNFFVGSGSNVMVPRVDFFVDSSGKGEFTVDIRPSSSILTVDTFIVETTPYNLYPMENFQKRVWHPIYPQIQGTSAQLRIYLSDEQMLNFDIVRADLQISAMMFYARASISRLQS